MTRLRFCLFACLLYVSLEGFAAEPAAKQTSPSATGPGEQRAVEYLIERVPRWRPEHNCSSCHHQGDGARSLFLAIKSGLKVGDQSKLQDTIEFLASPHMWDKNGPEGPFSDRHLARIQFAHALAAATDAGLIRDQKPLIAACEQLVENQAEDGSWNFTGADEIGSPIQYGRPLATAVAIHILRQSGDPLFRKNITAGEAWLRGIEAKSVLNAAAVILGLRMADDVASANQRNRCLAMIEKGQTTDGGWGPYVNSPPEPFDTAVVLLALVDMSSDPWPERVRMGRKYLEGSQLSDGSWPETTRPALRESYAHRVSTTGWALSALIATRIAQRQQGDTKTTNRTGGASEKAK